MSKCNRGNRAAGTNSISSLTAAVNDDLMELRTTVLLLTLNVPDWTENFRAEGHRWERRWDQC